jgi:hypothetical protein
MYNYFLIAKLLDLHILSQFFNFVKLQKFCQLKEKILNYLIYKKLQHFTLEGGKFYEN